MIKIITLILMLCSCTAAYGQSFSTSAKESNALPLNQEISVEAPVKDSSKSKQTLEAKDFINLAGVFLTVIGAVIIAYISQKAPRDMSKLEKLKIISSLSITNETNKPEDYLVIEEAYKQYYKCYIPIDIIRLLSNLPNRIEAFAAYKSLAGYCSYDQESKQITTYSQIAQNWRIALSVPIMLALLPAIGITAAVALSMIKIQASEIDFYLNITVALVSAAASLFFIYSFIITFCTALSLKGDFRKIKQALPNKVQFTKENTTDKVMSIAFIICLIPIYIIWGYLLLH